MNKDIKEQVSHFVAENLGWPPRKVEPDSTLFDDLGCSGTDALLFLESFAARFKVDLGDFDFCRHFLKEHERPHLCLRLRWKVLCESLYRYFGGYPRFDLHVIYDLVPISISDLVLSVQRGKLSTRELEGKQNQAGQEQQEQLIAHQPSSDFRHCIRTKGK
jgi:hypothetical protein